MTTTRRPIALVLGDDRRFVDDVVELLADEYDVRTAGSSAEALGIAENRVGVALLDESLSAPGRKEPLAALSDREGEPTVAFLPGERTLSAGAFGSVAECIPTSLPPEGSGEAIVRLFRQRRYDRLIEQFYATVWERTRITQSRTENREMRQERGTLEARENGIGEQLNELVARFDDEDFARAFRRSATGGGR